MTQPEPTSGQQTASSSSVDVEAVSARYESAVDEYASELDCNDALRDIPDLLDALSRSEQANAELRAENKRLRDEIDGLAKDLMSDDQSGYESGQAQRGQGQ